MEALRLAGFHKYFGNRRDSGSSVDLMPPKPTSVEATVCHIVATHVFIQSSQPVIQGA